MKTASGRAHGKVILIGEHAVVYGHPAIAIPVRGVGTEVAGELARAGGIQVVSPGFDAQTSDPSAGSRARASLKRLAEMVLKVFGEESQSASFRVRSDIPPGRGMGSSAALCVAMIRAVCGLFGRQLSADETASLALEAERMFHAAPSGIDTTVAAHDKPVYFVKRKGPQPVEAGQTAFRFLIADTGVSSSTADVVRDVARLRDADRARYDALFWEVGSMASVAREVIRCGSRSELGMCMNRNQELLAEIGVSCPEAERLAEAAREAGAAGAKISGAGRGGVVLALLGDETNEAALASALKQAGAKDIYETELRPAG